MEELLKVENLFFSYKSGGLFSPRRREVLKEITLSVGKKESLALLGESGSGKSTLGKLILRLLKPQRGKILFENRDAFKLGKEYTRKVSAVFQDPRGSLNPRYTAWEAIEEPLIVHGFSKETRKKRVEYFLRRVKLKEDLWFKKTVSLSGGERQRVAIARALVLEPLLVVADEPTSALDLSVQYEILKIFSELRSERSLIFITHDIRAAAKITERTALMLSGRLLEISPTESFVKKPFHPYGRYLLESLPASSPFERKPVEEIEEQPPTVEKEGCPFRFRCPERLPECEKFPPSAEVKLGEKTAKVWCWLYVNR